MNLRMGRIGVFDLSRNEAQEIASEDAPSEASMSSVRMADQLLRQHGHDAVVLSTGLLTGSLLPAAGASIVAGRSSAEGPLKLMPILGHAGVELKLSGFDHVVVTGVAPTAGYLWVRDGVMEFVERPDMPGTDSWARTDRIRADQGDAKIQVLATGPAGDSGHTCAQVVTDYWAGEDKAGLGALLGRKGLAAIAFRGMGELEVNDPNEHFARAVELQRRHLSSLGPPRGLESYSSAAARDDFRALAHRIVACFGCPFPCRTFLKVFEDPKEMRLVGKEPGFLCYDIPALESCFEAGLDAKTAALALMKCARAGVEPVSALESARANAPALDAPAIEAVLEDPRGVPGPEGRIMKGGFLESFGDRERSIICLGLGLCPRYWAKAGLDLEAVAIVAEPALGVRLQFA